MKKIFLIISFFLVVTFNFKVFAISKTYSYTWTNTSITVPLYADLDEYKNLPKASLYIDNILKEDANITLDTEGDWLYIMDNVNVNKIGEYQVWYKAYESKYKPGTCNNYKKLITFKVVDSIKPEIYQLVDDISFMQGEELTLDKYFKVTDNSSENIKTEFFYNFDNKKIGTYNAKIVATDENNNSSELSFLITITNSDAPKIVFTSVNNKIITKKGVEVDLKSYFTVTDDVDIDIQNKLLIISDVNFNKVGSYNSFASVTDSSNNKTTYDFTVEVKDEVLPEINLYQETKTYNYLYDLSKIDYLSFIKNVTDDNVIVDKSKVEYDTNIINEVGTYYVSYSYTDDGNNTCKKDLTIILKSTKAPTIEILNIPKIKQGETLDLETFINVIDDSDPLVKETLVINGDLDTNTVGTYTLEAYAKNTSGLFTTKNFYVVVEEDNFLLNYFTSDDVIYFGIIIIGFSSLGACLFLIKRNKNKETYNL